VVGPVARFEGGEHHGAALGVELEVAPDGARHGLRAMHEAALERLVRLLVGERVIGQRTPPLGHVPELLGT
jgi:hypothetical protein